MSLLIGADQLFVERVKIGELLPGQAVITPAFALQAEYIIHTVEPIWRDGSHGEFEQLQCCYENSLQLAVERDCKLIAFPLISTGTYDFPKDKALKIAISVFSRFLMQHEMKIILAVFDQKSFVLSRKFFDGVDEYLRCSSMISLYWESRDRWSL